MYSYCNRLNNTLVASSDIDENNFIILLADIPPRVQIFGNNMPLIVGQPHNVTCLVETCYEEDIIVSWTLHGKKLPGIVQVAENDGKLTTFISILNYDFTTGDEDNQLVCYVVVTCVVTKFASEVVDVHCKLCFSFIWG